MKNYALAKSRAIAKLAFYIHAAVFGVVNIILMTINLALAPQNIWFIWPMLGWGIGLAAHAGFLYFPSQWGHKLVRKMIRRELENLKESQDQHYSSI